MTASTGPSVRTLAAGPAPTMYAKWYGFTREIRDGVNKITAGVLGSVWVAHPYGADDGVSFAP
jgi:hypothetical protein